MTPIVARREPGRRIACVYTRRDCSEFPLTRMDYIRFQRISEALVRRGHRVDMIVNHGKEPADLTEGLRQVPFRYCRWGDYDAIKTLFHSGFEALVAEGGAEHPFIISKLGSVVGSQPTPGVHFHGSERECLFATQEMIARRSRYVTILTEPSARLWRSEHGDAVPVLLVPTGVDVEIPPPGENPYPALGIQHPVAICAGNLYSSDYQREVHALWRDRLNDLGRALRERGIQLVAMGKGRADELDPDAVRYVGAIPNHELWTWQHHAQAGVVLAQGPVQDNESSRIYYYLRSGLPVVCEHSVPNAALIKESGHGMVVPFGALDPFVDAVAATVEGSWSRRAVIETMIRQHSWDKRAALYDHVLGGMTA